MRSDTSDVVVLPLRYLHALGLRNVGTLLGALHLAIRAMRGRHRIQLILTRLEGAAAIECNDLGAKRRTCMEAMPGVANLDVSPPEVNAGRLCAQLTQACPCGCTPSGVLGVTILHIIIGNVENYLLLCVDNFLAVDFHVVSFNVREMRQVYAFPNTERMSRNTLCAASEPDR